jgi:hypothetical protein
VNPLYSKLPVKREVMQSQDATVDLLVQYSTVQYSTEGIGLVEIESSTRQNPR